MTSMVQLTVAGDVAEAEEIQALLTSAGIDSELQTAVDLHPLATDNAPQKVLVPESLLEEAHDVIEALTEPDELIAEP
jgi:type III secretory pathway lipoprotein EscJ